mmetsp:Transcript_11225/g.16395  ORF Transcript_11225/g.16395 Transcript_11225/m.16395 type:complete len:173 (+) Transcript_11225:293-811(+)
MIAYGFNLWSPKVSPSLEKYRALFLKSYASLPTNSQGAERGVKESGYVSLGCQYENQCSTLAITCATLVLEYALNWKDDMRDKGKQHDENEEEAKDKQLQGKKKMKALVEHILKQQSQLISIKICDECDTYTKCQKLKHQSQSIISNSNKREFIKSISSIQKLSQNKTQKPN